MATVKISALTELLAASIDAGDFLPIVDTSAVTTKKVSVGSFDARYLLEADINAKGDLFVGTADNTVGVLSVGANDTIPMADSATGTGIKWGSPTTVKTALGLDDSTLDERIRDTVGVALVAGANVTITVDDGANTITIASSGGGGGFTYGLDMASEAGLSRTLI